MEQHRTRPPQQGPRRGTPPLPPQAARGGKGAAAGRAGNGAGSAGRRRPGVSRPAPARSPLAGALRRLPNPRLTGLGGGLFCGAVMVLLGLLDGLLLGSLTAYSVLFVPVCLVTAAWVRRGDLLTAPVVAPIAFALGLLPVAEGDGGFLGRLMGLVTALATQAGWLYGGTLLAGIVVLARRVALLRERTDRRRYPV
ncbi:DUF6542 domain-containing protein [Streptomyces sp. NPDC091279]|uniref:DUF6542 domain-containing protein n=1 Tax=Streptomyces sp. NPDC091279 TaxID=3365983 RepID=UPI0038075621